MGKSQSKYKYKPLSLGNVTNDENLEKQEPPPSPSVSFSDISLKSPVGVTNTAASDKTEGISFI